jgi:hypothetical protein
MGSSSLNKKHTKERFKFLSFQKFILIYTNRTLFPESVNFLVEGILHTFSSQSLNLTAMPGVEFQFVRHIVASPMRSDM